jgi:hypothetical protein
MDMKRDPRQQGSARAGIAIEELSHDGRVFR